MDTPNRLQPDQDIDLRLREEIRLLGRILGNTLRELEGEPVFEMIEHTRINAIRFRRDRHRQAREELESTLNRLDTDQAIVVVRAFSFFSLLANIAEDQHHNRCHRADEAAGCPPREASIALALKRALEASLPKEKIADFFREALISPVLTAHPTEVQRRSILDRQVEIARLLNERNRIQLIPAERAQNEEDLARVVTTLWQTRVLRELRLTVNDEIENGLIYYRYTFLRQLPRLYAAIEDQLAREGIESAAVGTFLRIGSWIGGDRDGNPFVGARELRHALSRQSSIALEFYLEEVYRLGRELSQSVRVVRVSPELEKLSARSPDTSEQRRDEPYRRALIGIYSRLAATSRKFDHYLADRQASGESIPYRGSLEFTDDLAVLSDSLVRHGSGRVARGRLRNLIWASQIFGFHLAPLDMRQHSAVHENVVAELFARGVRRDGYAGLPEEQKRLWLLEELGMPRLLRSPHVSYRPETAAELDILDAAADLRNRFGRQAIPNYVISKTETVSDILEVALLLKEAGILRLGDGFEMDINIVPLFETIEDLRRCGATINELFSIPLYRELLRARDDVQEIMLGYSDSGKEGGYLSANWALHEAEVELVKVFARHNTRLRLFHGRGGTVGRGGGKSYEGVLAQPAGSVASQIRITEQGEVIASKYSDPENGWRNLEALVAATFESTLLPRAEAPPALYSETMEELGATAYAAYRGLVYETPGFPEFFHTATPISEIVEMNVGSRPAGRRHSDRIEDLRAIPWVFSWSQARIMLPGWYGFGSAVQDYLAGGKGGGRQLLREMYCRWPFFRTTLSNMEMLLAKSDPGIASRYAELVQDRELRTRIFGRIQDEWDLTIGFMLEIMEQKELLETNPDLARSIRNRSPYIDPLNHLQVELLRRYRLGEREDQVKRAILLTINGIAAGLRNSG